MSFEEYFQPPFSVFFLWAIFLGIIVLFHPIKTVIKKIFLCMGCTWCADEEVGEVDEGRDSEEDSHGDYWGALSGERKQEIDNLRAVALLKYLARFTLTLKKENMTSREPTEREVVVESVREISTFETNETSNGTGSESEEGDVERGFPNEGGLEPQEESKLEVMECSGEYTHILVPLPGRGISEPDDKPVNTEPVRTSWHSSLSKIKAPQDKPKNNEATEGTEENPTDIIERAVPIFCAVCLMEYELSDRVCWSSNRECTHVFHEDCIVQWLVSSGRTKSKRQYFSANPSEKRLMCYELQCPCCRQEFISKEARDSAVESA